jgi:hypothetical protein
MPFIDTAIARNNHTSKDFWTAFLSMGTPPYERTEGKNGAALYTTAPIPKYRREPAPQCTA